LQIFFTIPALVTLGLGFLVGVESWNALIRDFKDKRLKSRAGHIIADIGFIAAASCALITALHNLTQIWIR
jgi:hypothetical protein